MTFLINSSLARLLAAGTGVLIAAAGTVVPAHAAAAPTPGASGLGDRLYPKLGNGGYDAQNYDLHLTYPAKDVKQSVTGDVTVTAVSPHTPSPLCPAFPCTAVCCPAVY